MPGRAVYECTRRSATEPQPCLTHLCALAVAAGLSMGNRWAVAEPAGFIHADGTRLVDGQGADFAVKGINLGNWLVPEGYMFKFKQALSPTEIAAVVEKLLVRRRRIVSGRSFAMFMSARMISIFSKRRASTPYACR